MAQISYIKSSDILEARRYDAEYFKPEYLEIEQEIKKFDYLELGDKKASKLITDGDHGNPDYTENVDDMNYVKVEQLGSIDLDLSSAHKISKKCVEKQSKTNFVEKFDILLSMKGTLGRSCLVLDDYEAVLNRDVAKIQVKKEMLNPFYVLIYLKSKIGNSFIEKFSSGAVQKGLYLNKIEKIKIPILPESFQLHIEEIVKSAHQKQLESKQLYSEAEQLLLAELGLLDYQVKHSLWFTTTKNDVSEAHRYDSEYFQPKYAEIIKKIESYGGGYFKLSDKNYAKISRGSLIPDSFYNSEKGNPYIRGADFSSGILGNDKLVFIDDSFQKTRETMVRENDIIFSLIGSVGATAVVSKDFDNSFISNNTGKITIKNFDSIVLQIILQSIIGKLQFEKEKTQTAQPKISSDQVGNFKIPLIKPSIQKQIAGKIQESHRLRKESKELLEEAKRKVEEEIEK